MENPLKAEKKQIVYENWKQSGMSWCRKIIESRNWLNYDEKHLLAFGKSSGAAFSFLWLKKIEFRQFAITKKCEICIIANTSQSP